MYVDPRDNSCKNIGQSRICKLTTTKNDIFNMARWLLGKCKMLLFFHIRYIFISDVIIFCFWEESFLKLQIRFSELVWPTPKMTLPDASRKSGPFTFRLQTDYQHKVVIFFLCVCNVLKFAFANSFSFRS